MKIVIIEDHLMFRDLVRRVCTEEMSHEVIGESGSGIAGAEIVLRLNPDLVILDLRLPDIDGFAVARTIRSTHPRMKFLILSCQVDEYTLVHVERGAFQGFVDKATDAIEVLGVALAQVAEGKTFFSPEFRRAQRARRVDSAAIEKILSETEQEILSLVGEGLSDEEIGDRVGIASTTAQTHRSRLLKKLGIKSTPKLIMFAQRCGFSALPTGRMHFPRPHVPAISSLPTAGNAV